MPKHVLRIYLSSKDTNIRVSRVVQGLFIMASCDESPGDFFFTFFFRYPKEAVSDKSVFLGLFGIKKEGDQ